MGKPRIFYFAPVAPNGYDHAKAAYLENSALRNKVLGICGAIKVAGGKSVVVSTFGAVNSAQKAVRAGKMPLVALASKGRGPIRRLSSCLNYLAFAMKGVKRGDKVILYNFFPEYALAALWLKLVGRPAILDIEDAPSPEEGGLRGLVNQLSFGLIKSLCADKQIIVSGKLAENLKLKTYLPVYGVSSQFEVAGPASPKFSGDETHILYGGAIMPDTGLYLFIDALRVLAARPQSKPLHFHVTGRFEPKDFAEISRELEGHKDIRLSVMRDLSYADYKDLLLGMDIGLSLKRSKGAFADTTFPSKVIEFGAVGLLLCATVISDVPLIFNDQSALLIAPETPETLAALIEDAAQNPERSRQMAATGQDLVRGNFSSQRVGEQLLEFLHG